MNPTRDTYRRPVVLPSGGPPRRPAPRRHPRRPARSGSIPPAQPRSGKHRRKMLKACYRGLGRLLCRPVAELVTAWPVQLMTWAEAIPTGDGRRGRARRLAMKVARLRATA